MKRKKSATSIHFMPGRDLLQGGDLSDVLAQLLTREPLATALTAVLRRALEEMARSALPSPEEQGQ
jgi:hypothetical protein